MPFDGNEIRSCMNGTLDHRPACTFGFPETRAMTRSQIRRVRARGQTASWGPGGDPHGPPSSFALGGQKGAATAVKCHQGCCSGGWQCPSSGCCTKAGEGAPLGHPWTGLIAGLAVHDRALSAQGIASVAGARMARAVAMRAGCNRIRKTCCNTTSDAPHRTGCARTCGGPFDVSSAAECCAACVSAGSDCGASVHRAGKCMLPGQV